MNVVRVKVPSFAIASFIAGLGGSLLGYRRGVVTFDSFPTLASLTLLSTAYLAGITSVWGGVLAGVLAASGIVFFALDRWVDLGDWFAVITGVALIVTVIRNPEGLAAGGHDARRRSPGPVPAAATRVATVPSAGGAAQPAPAPAPVDDRPLPRGARSHRALRRRRRGRRRLARGAAGRRSSG